MPRYQFAHLDWASTSRRAPGRSKSAGRDRFRSRGWAIRDIVAEASREPRACPHVENPRPPILLYGCPLEQLVEIAEGWGRQAKTTSGGKYRKNQPVAACGVFSCPGELTSSNWDALKMRFIDYLKERYDDRLRSVIEHVDEAHPHLHFYLVPLDGEGFGTVHAGYLASREVRRNIRPAEKEGDRSLGGVGSNKRVRGPGYIAGAHFRDAMREWQDDIYTQVCEPFGLQRISPDPQRRVSRAEAMRNKQREAERKALIAQIKAKDNLLARQHEAFAAKLAVLNAKIAQLGEVKLRSESNLAGQQGERGVPESLLSADSESPTQASRTPTPPKANGQTLVGPAKSETANNDPEDDADDASDDSSIPTE